MKYYSLQFGSGDPRTFTGLAPTFLIFVDMTTGLTIAPPAITESATGWGVYQFQWGTTHPIAFLADAATTSPGTAGRYVTGQIDPADRADEYGTTMVALGNTAIQTILNVGTTLGVLGSSIMAFGATSVALGNTAIQNILNVGTTLVAIGNTAITDIVNQGLTLVAIGNSSIALGNTAIADITNNGTTLVAIGNTSVAIGTSLYAIGLSSNALLGSSGSTFGGQLTDPIDLFGYMKRLQELWEGDNNYVKGSGGFSQYSRGSSTLLRAKTIANSISLVTKTGQ